ncbi:ABC transporter [Gardnerella vaginalis]|uniref:ABC transporter n=1 Tax=Gardnerella vaginalis TaxID=2702 RepID=UPI0039F104E5
MINRFFAFVPGVKHLVALKSACLAVSSLLNIALVYVCVGILSPVLRPIHTSHQSLMSTVELTSYVIAFLVLVVIKYLILRWSYSLGGDISNHVAMRLRPKMLRAILSLRLIKDENTPYLSDYSKDSQVLDEHSNLSLKNSDSLNSDVENMQMWCGLFIPQVFASVVTPLVISAVLFSVNPSIAAISLMTAVFTVATAFCALILEVSPIIRCSCALFAYISAAAAIISTIWVSSIRGVGLPSAMLTMPLLMLSIEPLRRCGRYMHMATFARKSFERISYLLKRVADSPVSALFADDSTKLALPDGANNLALIVKAEIPSSDHSSIHSSNHSSDFPSYLKFVAQTGSINFVPAKFNDIVRSAVLSGAGFSTNADVTLRYNDRYELDDASDDSYSYNSYDNYNYDKDDSPFVGSESFSKLEQSSKISLSGAKPGALADLVSVVSERSHLFADTLRSNLLMAAPLATTTSMWEALREAKIDGIVYADYDGLDLRIDRFKENAISQGDSRGDSRGETEAQNSAQSVSQGVSQSYSQGYSQGDSSDNSNSSIYDSECTMRKFILARALLRHTPVYIVDFSRELMGDRESAKICAILRKLSKKAIVIALMPTSAHESGIVNNEDLLPIEFQNKSGEVIKNNVDLSDFYAKNNDLAEVEEFKKSASENKAENDFYKESGNSGNLGNKKYSNFVYSMIKAFRAFVSVLATAISVSAAIFIPVCTVASMFAMVGRPIFGFNMQECLQGTLICMLLRLITLLASFAGFDFHKARQRKASLTMTLGLTFATIPAFLLLWHFNKQLMILSIVIYVLVVVLIPWYRFVRSSKIERSVHKHMHVLKREVQDIELGMDEVLAFRVGEQCVDRMIQTMERISVQRMRLARRLATMCSLVMSVSLVGMLVGTMIIAQNVHPEPANIPAWSTVYAVMAVIVLVSLLKQIADVVLRRTQWVVNFGE